MNSMEEYFNGTKLYGNDFSESDIQKWFDEEEEAYSFLKKDKNYSYEYDAMNAYYGYHNLKNQTFNHVLGIGSAYGHEFLPYISHIKKITILEPSDTLKSEKLGHLAPTYQKPKTDGSIGFEDNSFDLITCFGVLHHIPNVSYVLSEMIRVLSHQGILLLREPIRTMGDWRYARKGLTKNERGIPHTFFDNYFKRSDLEIVKKSFCDSNFLHKVINKIYPVKRNSLEYQNLDSIVSNALKWNINYHPKSFLQKIAPGSVFYIIKKK